MIEPGSGCVKTIPERSPNTNNSNNFCNVTTSGAANNNNANNSNGVCFGFRNTSTDRQSRLMLKSISLRKDSLVPALG